MGQHIRIIGKVTRPGDATTGSTDAADLRNLAIMLDEDDPDDDQMTPAQYAYFAATHVLLEEMGRWAEVGRYDVATLILRQMPDGKAAFPSLRRARKAGGSKRPRRSVPSKKK